MKINDLTGQIFGKLKALRPGAPTKSGAKTWTCECACKKETAVQQYNLVKGATKSCGCIRIKCQGDEASFRALYQDYQSGAKSRGLAFEISHEDFRIITSSDCVYCGAPPSKAWRARKGLKIPYIYNGVDRLDNSKGYVEWNYAACCSVCNRMKFQMSKEDFVEHAKKIARYNGN